jgi:hypothetical protein
MTLGRLRAAKNIILAGVKSVTLLDSNPVELRDLSGQVACPPLAPRSPSSPVPS